MSLDPSSARRARELHASAIVVDTAAPTACPGGFSSALEAAIDRRAAAGAGAGELLLELDEGVERALAGDALPQWWEAWAASGVDVASVTVGVFGPAPFTWANAERDLARWERLFARHARLLHVRSAGDARRAWRDGLHGVLLHLADAAPIERDLARLARLRSLGLCSAQLTYNARNALGSGCTAGDGGGLTPFGWDAVREMNDLGLLVDLAHASDRTALDAIEAAVRPVAMTHTACRALADIDRATGDDVLRALGAADGYVGILLTPFTLAPGEAATLDTWLAHLGHAVELAGIDHVGIGSDWGVGFPSGLLEALNAELRRPGYEPSHPVDWGAHMGGFERWTAWPNLTEALVGAGYRDDEIRGLLGENFLRTFAAACD